MRLDKDLGKCCACDLLKVKALKKNPCSNTIKTGWKTKAYNLHLNIWFQILFIELGLIILGGKLIVFRDALYFHFLSGFNEQWLRSIKR